MHFQGYDISLIPLVVEYIPSVHICTEMVLDLLNINHKNFEFGINLAMELIKKYPLDNTLKLGYEVIKRAIVLAGMIDKQAASVDQNDICVIFIKSLPAILELGKVFPGRYIEQIAILLNGII